MEKPHSKVHVGHRAVLSRNQKSNGHRWWASMFLGVLFACTHCQSDSNLCTPGIGTIGRTWPQGDIVMESNQSLKIYCILDDVLTLNSSNLVFFRKNELLGPEYTTIVNSTTALLHVENVSPSDDMYYCRAKLNHHSEAKYEVVCLNRVVVGFKPQKPRKFSCVSKNWEELVCTWDPEPNSISTRYSLRLRIPRRAVGGHFLWPCPVPRHDQPPNTCVWDSLSEPMYRQLIPEFIFLLEITNVLGSRTVEYVFNHFANVIPSRPEGLTVVDKTYSSIRLRWSVPYAMRHFPPGLYFRISYRSQYDPKNSWKTVDLQNEKYSHISNFNLTNLQYAHAAYDIRVSMKSAIATGEDRWSEFSEITVKTASRVPGLPPKTDVGSFETFDFTENRDVYIYWQRIPQQFENGDNITYQVISVKENGQYVDLQPSEQTEAFAKFSGISFQKYDFEITTANSNGRNNQTALVHVPSHRAVPHGPTDLTKTAYGNGTYEISWIPSRYSIITNYTLFWCESDPNRPYRCTEYLHWIHVPWNLTSYNVSVPDAQKWYEFAVSVNELYSSSGMKWVSCTARNNHVRNLQSVRFGTVTSNEIQVQWTLDCAVRSIQGFVIYYCPIVSPHNATCKYPRLTTLVEGDRYTSYGDLNGLQPYTTYEITVAVMTERGEGAQSDLTYVTTLEGPPSPPREVSVVDATDTTITIEWKPPTPMNGVLRHYTVFWNGKSMIVERPSTRLQIRNLEPDTSYNISVSATTIGEGRRSRILARTRIGGPQSSK